MIKPTKSSLDELYRYAGEALNRYKVHPGGCELALEGESITRYVLNSDLKWHFFAL